MKNIPTKWRILIGILATAIWLTLAKIGISQLYWPAYVFVASAISGTLIIMGLLPWIPNAIKYLSNDPNRFASTVDKESRLKGEFPIYDFGFFTFLSPDQAKIIERGKRFIRIVMRLDDHTFRGETVTNLQTNEMGYWDIIETPSGEVDFHPVADKGFISWINPFWWWCRYVYLITGGVFTGIPPFQKVRTYRITRLEKIPVEGGGFVLVPKTDWSDHYRVADDQLFIEVQAAETRDKLPVDVQQALTLRVTNPYRTAYNTESNWAVRAMTAAIDSINTYTRGKTADEVLSVVEGDDPRAFSKKIVGQLNGKAQKTTGKPVLSEMGLHVSEAALLRNNLDTATQDRLKEEALAHADARAREARGLGEAKATGHLMDAVIKRGMRGMEVFQTEAGVRKAKATGESGGTIILDNGSTSGTINPGVAFLHQSLKGAE